MTDHAMPSHYQVESDLRPVRVDMTHRYVVSVLKVLLPTVALTLVLLVIIWPMIYGQNAQFAIDLTSVDRNGVETITMQNARYSGIDDSEQQFAITAASMNQDDPDSVYVHLETPKADIMLSDGSWAAITAIEGEYNREAQLLVMSGGVNLFHDMGYEFQTERANLDLVKGEAFGNEPVVGQGPFGYLEANGFRIFNRGERVVLTGQSKVIIYSLGGESEE